MKYHQKQKVIGYYKTRKEAMEALVQYNHDPFELDGLQVTFDDIFQKIEFTPSTTSSYKNAYKYLAPVSDKPIRTIRPAQLQECIDSCQNTQNILIKTICKRVYHKAIMYAYVDKDISQFLVAHTKETEIEREVFTHEEIEELWNMTEYWWAKITLILLYSGMRTKELRTINPKMVDFEKSWLDITMAKNKCSIRGIPIHKRVLPLFRNYIDAGGNLYGYGHGNLNRYLREFHGHRAHDCRHTFTTRMREIGVDHVTIQRLVGHTPSDITYKVYTHISPEELQEAIQKLEY